MKKFRVVFMGTPEFAVPCLKMLSEQTEVVGVVTQPDKPRGRGQKMMASPVKAFAEKKGIPVYQPVKVREEEFIGVLENLKPDLMVVVAFGQILPRRVLDIPAHGCINVHASLLPRYRGAAPMQWSIIHGEKKTGITTMFMDAGLDTGDMLLKQEIGISEDMTLEELHDALMGMGAEVLQETLGQLSDGTLKREPQADEDSSYAPMIGKETGRIDWEKPAKEIHDLVRGLNSWPGAYTFLKGSKYKIWRTRVLEERPEGAPGTVLRADKSGLVAAAGDVSLEILEMQAPGGKKMKARDYLLGHGIELPARFDG